MKFLPSVLSRSGSAKNSLGIIRPHFGSKGGSAIHWINHNLPVDSAIVFLNAYRLDSAIQQLNNRDHLKSNVENSGIGSLDTVSHQSWTTSSYKVTSSEKWIIRENSWSEICSVRYWFNYMLTTLRKEKQRKGEIMKKEVRACASRLGQCPFKKNAFGSVTLLKPSEPWALRLRADSYPVASLYCDLVSSRCVTFSHSFPSALARFKLPLPYSFARIRLGTSLD